MRVAWRDRFRELRVHSTIGSGKHPVYDPGAEDWTSDYGDDFSL